VYCPNQECPSRVRQFGDDTGQLAVKVRSVLLAVRPVQAPDVSRLRRPASRGLPEELMSISAMALTVRAHDARHAAYRLYLIHAARTESIR